MQLYFYELHEGATDLMTDALLVSDRDHTPGEFVAMVETARKQVLDTFACAEESLVSRPNVHGGGSLAGNESART